MLKKDKQYIRLSREMCKLMYFYVFQLLFVYHEECSNKKLFYNPVHPLPLSLDMPC